MIANKIKYVRKFSASARAGLDCKRVFEIWGSFSKIVLLRIISKTI